MAYSRPLHRKAVLGLFLPLVFLCCNRESEGTRAATPIPIDSPAPPSPGVSQSPGATGSSGRLGSFQSVFTDVARKAVPSVVSITSERTVTSQGPDFFGGDPFEFFFGPGGRGGSPRGPQRRRESGLGSGLIASSDGIILTNNHVVEGAQRLTVQLADEREFEAEVVGTDPATDLAVIRIKDRPADLVPLEFGNSDQLLIGEWVVAVGAPFGLFETVTVGIISAKGRQNTGITTYGNFLQTDAAINPGNSGGPLVNLEGKVIGINTAIFSQSGGYQGIGFAIPVNLARNVMENLVKHGKVTRGWLGISIQPLTSEMGAALGLKNRKGALVGDVVEGGPAERSGIRRGDVILAINGRQVVDANDLMNQVAQIQPGTTAELSIWRDGRQTRIKARVARREEERAAALNPRGGEDEDPEAGGMAALGIQAADLNDQTRERFRIGRGVRRGAVVVAVDPAGPAAEEGIQEGDVILEVGRKPVGSAAELRSRVAGAPKGSGILLLVSRGGNTSYVLVTPK